jgi:hypothetical protein
LGGISANSNAQIKHCATATWKEVPPKAVVEISLKKTKIHIREWGSATFRIKNCGSYPFYIPKTIGNVEWHGGFEDTITGPFDAKGVLRMVEAADYGPDYHPNVLKEIQESWILLMPGDFYGGTVQLHTAPLSPGTYKVVGRRCPPRLSDELRRQLFASLKFPVLLEPVDSKPVYLKVVK